MGTYWRARAECVPVPQLMEAVVEVTPQERVQNRTPEQIVDVLVPQIVEERVQLCTLDQIFEFPVPRIMEAIVEVVPSAPQERVQNRTPEQILDVPVPRTMEERVPSCIQEQIMDLPVPQIMVASKAYTGKVFTVGMRHHRGDQACPVDTVGLNIKGLDKYNMPRSGDVMVPALHMEVPSLHEAVTRFFEQHALEDGLISWETLEATLPPGLFRELRRRAQELTAFEEEEEEEEAEEEGEILASS